MAFYPSSLTVQELPLAANTALVFPYSTGTGVQVTDIIDVAPTQNGYNIYLPNATQTQAGFFITFNNVSAFSFTVTLNDRITNLLTINAGGIVDVYLVNSTTTNGTWRFIPSGGGTNSIVALSVTGSDGSVNVTNPNITPPGGTVDLALPQALSAIMNLVNLNTPGYLVVTSLNPFAYQIRTLQDDSNIVLTNPGGVNGNTTIGLSPNVAVNQLDAGNIVVQGNIIQNTDSNGILAISSFGTSSLLTLNNVDIDTNSNVSNINNLSISGSFNSPNTLKAWCRFTNTAGTIVALSKVNVATITYNSINSQYLITFTTPMGNTNYGVEISCSNSGTPPNLGVRIGYDVSRSTGSVSIVITDGSGEYLPDAPDGITVSIMSLT